MSKEQEKDKEILENLDRIVAGKNLEDEAGGIDDKTKATLELTREMTSWSKSPPPEYRRQMKARLIHKLAQEEKKSSDLNKWLSAEFMRSHAWQLTFGGIVMVVVAAIIYVVVSMQGC